MVGRHRVGAFGKAWLPLERCLELRRGMAVRHTRADYLEAALLADDLLLATWIIASDGVPLILVQ